MIITEIKIFLFRFPNSEPEIFQNSKLIERLVSLLEEKHEDKPVHEAEIAKETAMHTENKHNDLTEESILLKLASFLSNADFKENIEYPKEFYEFEQLQPPRNK